MNFIIQKNLYNKVSLFIFSLLCNFHCAYTMEKPTEKIEVATSIFGPEHSLKNQCLKYINTHADKVSLISKLPNLPVDVASDIILTIQPPYLAEHTDALISLVCDNTLDHAVSSSIAQVLCNYKKEKKDSTICIKTLVHAIAKNGRLSDNLAPIMVTDFVTVEIPDNFDELFNDYLPEDVLKNNNEQLLSSFLQLPVLPAAKKDNGIYISVSDYAELLPVILNKTKDNFFYQITCNANKKYTTTIPFLFLTKLHCKEIFSAYINPEHTVLVMHFKSSLVKDQGVIGLINMNTTFATIVSCDVSIDQLKRIALNADCSQVDIMQQDETICSYELSRGLATFFPSFKQKAFIYYMSEKHNAIGEKIARLVSNPFMVFTLAGGDVSLVTTIMADADEFLTFIRGHRKDFLDSSPYAIAYNGEIKRLEESVKILTPLADKKTY